MFRHTNHYTQTPKIRVDFIFTDGLITRTSLTPADEFSVHTKHPKVLKWVKAYKEHGPLPLLPLSWEGVTPFAKTVLQCLMQSKSLISYSALASQVNRPNAQRAVGNVMNRNPFPLVIPCHRVISSTGELGGYVYGSEMKRQLLQFEGFFV